MWLGFETLVENVGLSFENIILLLIFAGGLIFYARDIKVGVVLHFLGFALAFMWFYSAGYTYSGALVLALMFLVILALTFYALSKRTEQGAIV